MSDSQKETFESFLPPPWTDQVTFEHAAERARSAGWTGVERVARGHRDLIIGVPPEREGDDRRTS